ncbi:MAG TPA: carboxylesterase/lipase family protein [Acidimicrobiales bacterium]
MTIVETKYGKLQGTTNGGISSFKGVPFAAPPVGDLRFRPPVPPQPWEGTRAADAFGAVAPQVAQAGVAQGDGQRQSEDCLYLNVWTPGLDGTRPVMVWIHGGAFQNGSGSLPLYDGTNLASNGDVVVVTMNYRLGVLGWLASEQLAAEPGAPAGNWGLLDQVAALRWVSENIRAFGGDPGNVTIFGESAGSVSVSTLLGTPAARGLFHKAIAQSGGPGGFSMSFAERFAAELIEEAGVADVAALRHTPVDELLEAQERIAKRVGRLNTALAPVVDGGVLAEQALAEIRDGINRDVPLLAGTNRDEMRYFAIGDRRLTGGDEELVLRRLSRTNRDAAAWLYETYRGIREARGLDTSPFALWVAIESDRVFRVPSLRMAESQAAAGAPVYEYLFDWESPAVGGLLKSCHALEIAFALGNLDKPAMDVFCGSGPEAEQLSQTMMGAWLAFAHTGDPSTDATGTWPRYDAARRATLRLGRTVEVLDAPMEEERRAWEGRVTGRMSAA